MHRACTTCWLTQRKSGRGCSTPERPPEHVVSTTKIEQEARAPKRTPSSTCTVPSVSTPVSLAVQCFNGNQNNALCVPCQ